MALYTSRKYALLQFRRTAHPVHKSHLSLRQVAALNKKLNYKG